MTCLQVVYHVYHKYSDGQDSKHRMPNDKVHAVSFYFLAPHKVGLFNISVSISKGICTNKVLSTQKINLFLVV